MSDTKFCESCDNPKQTKQAINVNDHTTTSPPQTIERYIDDNKKMYDIIYEYIDNSD